MTPVRPSRTLSVAIERPPGEVYGFVSNPENLPRWALGLGRSIRQPGMSEAQYADDAALVERDLRTLKALLERETPRATP